jgi:hypothetical protein
VTDSRDPPIGWLTISDLARKRGVDKAAISRRCAKFAASGLLECRTFGQSKIVNVEAFDRACAATVDAVRELNGRRASSSRRRASRPAAAKPTVSAPAPDPPSPASTFPNLAAEQAKRASFDAELKRLDLAERLGRLVEIDDVRRHIEGCSIELARAIDRLPGHAETLAARVTKDGVAGLRGALRDLAREMRETLAGAAERFADGKEADEVETAADAEVAA